MKTLSIVAVAGLAAAATANPALEWRGPASQPTNFRGPTASGTFTINLADAEHRDPVGTPGNTVLLFDVNAQLGGVSGAAASMTGIGWDVSIETVSPSWLSEAQYYFDDNISPDFFGLFLTPGIADSFSGTGSYSSGGILDLGDAGIADIALANGILRIELADSFDDFPGGVDAFANGTLTIAADYTVPAPAGLALLGLGGLVASRRRR